MMGLALLMKRCYPRLEPGTNSRRSANFRPRRAHLSLIDKPQALPALILRSEVIMNSVSLIPWQAMELLPEDRKDGRPMLLWNQLGVSVAAWDNSDGVEYWCLAFGGLPTGKFPVIAPTHWSDISPPV